ncbi:16190_t:CDS:10 [Acaulospora colombiana]|uniref:16190_t:CDS:1 n=1 Tax=Acaulospora colombiana TaxID=27376 RepID=A0ACA9K450_9GLOM|nr:16190_t:CDS:10 [Acaulospora colombiana]
MVKIKKSVKKFQKNHLKRTVERRNQNKKVRKGILRKQQRKNNITDVDGEKTSKKKEENLFEFDEHSGEEQDFEEFLNGQGEENESRETDESLDEFNLSDLAKSSEEETSDDESDNKPTHKNKRSLDEEVAEHKKQLDSLKEKDSEFYKYLQENDSELLDFDVSDDSNDENEDGDDDSEEGEKKEKMKLDDSDEEETMALKEAGLEDDIGTPTLTAEMITKWQESITESRSLKSLKQLLLAFRAAAHINDDEDEKTHTFRITDPAVFNNLVVVCLKYVTGVFDHRLNVKNQETPKSNLLYMLKQVTEDDMIYFIVKESEKAIPYYACYQKLASHYLKQLLDIWGTAEDKTRIIAFLNIRRLASTVPPPFIDLCLKGIYTTFVRYCKDTTAFTIPSINLMRNCAVEIYGIDLKSSYQSAFGYIRQLAIHLRNSNHNKSEATFNAVYNWQYVHCIEYWSKVLATYCNQYRISVSGENSLKELIYPFVQVTTGVIRLIPTAQYFPLQFHLRRKPKPSTLKPLDFASIIKAPKSYLHTRVYQDGICEELVELLFEYYSCFCLSIAFPELVIPPIVQIKRHIKNSKNLKLNKQLQQLVEKLEQNSKYIEQHRSQIDFSPNDFAQTKAFLRDVDPCTTPLYAYVMSSRKLKEQRKKLELPDDQFQNN